MNEVRVRVPATTANLGPGFDCLGIALQIYNTTTVRRVRGGTKGSMADEAAKLFFKEASVRPFSFSWQVDGSVPQSRGLGSSVTVRLGILHGLNRLTGQPLDDRKLFSLCAALEGHPDNAAPAAFGGFTVCPASGPIQRYKVDKRLAFVVLLPPFEISTPAARRALPRAVPFRDAVFNTSNAAAVAAAFAAGNYNALRGCLNDRLHQPFRERLIPCLSPVIEAAIEAGALGGWLSGSGSAIACATLRGPEKIARAMALASDLDGACALVVRADNTGVKILA